MPRSIIPRLSESAQKQIRQQLAKGGDSHTTASIAAGNKTTAPDRRTVQGPRLPVEFTMPIPPSVNHLFSNASNKRIKSSGYRAWWDAALKELVFIQNVPHLSGEVAIFFEIRRLSDWADLSNRIKSAEDVIVAARIIEDDRFVLELHAKWSRTIPSCRVRIEPR